MEKPGGFWIPKESTWEELAFAEDDAAGSCWPPRSYTCSFCRREFRSAQALGGHMNVHRRDRARLKQSDDHQFSNPKDEIRETSCFTLVFNSNPNPSKSKHSCVIAPSGLLRKQDTSYPSPSFVVESSKKILSYEIPVMEGYKKRKIERDVSKTGFKATTDLSVSMNLVIHQGFQEGGHDETERGEILKRRRMCETSSQAPILISSLSCKSAIITRNEEIKHKGDHFEDLDLELRLGADPLKGN